MLPAGDHFEPELAHSDHGSDLLGTDLVILGDCNPDVIVLGGDVTPAFGQQEKLVGSMRLVIGGSATITAVAAARLGLRVALVAAVGDDPAGQLMTSMLMAEGVDVCALAVRPGQATGMTVVLSRGSDRAILTATAAMASLTAGDVPDALVTSAAHVHVSSYFLLEDSLGPGLPGLFAAARAAGATTSLDTNWDPAGRWGGPQLRALLAQTDLLLPNEAEALALSGADSLDDAIGRLTAAGPRVVVKLGARGARSSAPGLGDNAAPRADNTGLAGSSVQYDVSVPPVEPADTTGAGDCFNAGLITGLLRGLDLPHAAALGCAVGAASTQALGGTGSAPALADVLPVASAAVIRPVHPAGHA
jgi:sugar/nucleoside kinase (ribokinase family)